VTGNHEYIGGVEQAVAYLREHGVTVLRDSCVTLPSGVIIAGREDRSSSSFAGKKRKDLSEILDGADTSKPVILMDHQPFHLEEAEHAGVDFQLSGHTHHGQLWPLNYITNAIYEISWGYLRKGATQYYVSCGAGTWGPPVRLGNRPEILHFRIIPDGTLGVD
jgi:predicted MPP superfamily phosphohydrolase